MLLIDVALVLLYLVVLLVHIRRTYALRHASLQEALGMVARRRGVRQEFVAELAMLLFSVGVTWYPLTHNIPFGEIPAYAILLTLVGGCACLFLLTFISYRGIILARRRIRELEALERNGEEN